MEGGRNPLFLNCAICLLGFPGVSVGKTPHPNSETSGFNLWVRKTPGRRKWQPNPWFLPRIPRTEEPSRLQSIGLQKSWMWLTIIYAFYNECYLPNFHFILIILWNKVNERGGHKKLGESFKYSPASWYKNKHKIQSLLILKPENISNREDKLSPWLTWYKLCIPGSVTSSGPRCPRCIIMGLKQVIANGPSRSKVSRLFALKKVLWQCGRKTMLLENSFERMFFFMLYL